MRVARGSVEFFEKVRFSLTKCTEAPLSVVWSMIERKSTGDRASRSIDAMISSS